MGRVKSKPTKAKAKAKAKVKPKREIKNTWLEKSIVVTTRLRRYSASGHGTNSKIFVTNIISSRKQSTTNPWGFSELRLKTSKFSWSWKRKRRMFSPPFFTHRDLLAANNILRKGISELWSGCKTECNSAIHACTQESHSL